MTSSELLITGLYLAVSIAGFALCRWLAIALSGPRASTRWYWLSVITTITWGMVQLNTARNGSFLFLAPENQLFMSNEPVRWVAFVGSLLQTLCTPDSEKPKRWYWF
ncbi:hypothetical protein [Pseudomonas putida]